MLKHEESINSAKEFFNEKIEMLKHEEAHQQCSRIIESKN
jgi:hypothetical protein